MSQGLVFNGATDYLRTPIITYDTIILDAYITPIQNSTAMGYVIDTPNRTINGFLRAFNIANPMSSLGYFNTVTGTVYLQRTTITCTKSPSVTQWLSFFESATGGNNVQGVIYQIKVYNAGSLVLYYNLTNPTNVTGATVKDMSGNGNNGTIYGSPQWLIKTEPQGLVFNGVTDSIATPTITSYDTIVLDCYIETKQNNYAYIIGNITGKIMRYQGSSTTDFFEPPEFTTATGLISGIRTTITLASPTYTQSRVIGIFTRDVGAGTGTMTKGIIYDVKVYNGGTLVLHYDLTQQSNVKGNTIYDSISGTYNGTIYGSPQWLTKPEQQGIQFNGVSDFINIPYSNIYNPSTFTTEVWFRPTTAVGVKNINNWLFYNGHTQVAGGNGYSIKYDAVQNQVAYMMNNGSTGDNGFQGGTVLSNQINHVVLIFDGSTINFYLNGVLLNSKTVTGFTTNLSTVAKIGNNNSGNIFQGGVIYALRCYSGVMNSQVQQMYQSGISGLTRSNLVGEWCIDLTGKDTSGNGNHGTLTGTKPNIKPETQGFRFNGATDSFVIPNITIPSKIDTIVMDALVESLSGTAIFGESLGSVFVQSNGTLSPSAYPNQTVTPTSTGSRTTYTITTSSSATSKTIFLGYGFYASSGHYAKGILYSVKCYGAGILLASYDFTSNTPTKDLSGNGNNGTLNGSPKTVQKSVQQGLRFNGATDYFASKSSLVINRILIDLIVDTSSPNFCGIIDGLSNYQIGTGSGTSLSNGSGFSTIKVNGVTTSVYQKGVRFTLDVTSSSTFTTPSNGVTFFCWNGHSSFTNGTIYSIQLYNSSTLVASYDLTSNTPTIDLSGNGNNGTLGGSPQKVIKYL